MHLHHIHSQSGIKFSSCSMLTMIESATNNDLEQIHFNLLTKDKAYTQHPHPFIKMQGLITRKMIIWHMAASVLMSTTLKTPEGH